MHITAATLHTIELPLVSPFVTSFGRQDVRRALLVELTTEADGTTISGWGEGVALTEPVYSPEYLDGSRHVIERFLLPRLARVEELTAETVAHHLRAVKGHRMAKASVEMAVLDAQLRARGISFGQSIGATVDRVPSGVSVGIFGTDRQLVDAVGAYLDAGYVRIKLKIEPGRDIAPVRAVREAFGDDVLLQVDANTAYTLVDAPHLRRLDEFGLLLIEQPLGEDDIRQHALLAEKLETPICLDESISSAEAAADAIAIGAAEVINIKAGRVGGYLEAVRIHDLAKANGVAVWCGGMLETGLGRAANAGLAALPGFTLPGDISASDRFYRDDITEPIVLDNGYIAVPTGPGFGATIIAERLAATTVSRLDVALDGPPAAG